MNKTDLLQYIAKTGYNVGFGAKRHFATYDMVEKIPGIIGIVSIAVGILALINDFLAKGVISAIFLIGGVIGLNITVWDSKKSEYEKAGVKLTQIFNELEKLYLKTKALDEGNFSDIEKRVNDLESELYATAISKQILLSNWYAHYKFFWELQIKWLDDELHFKLFRDKLPLSLIIWSAIIIISGTSFIVWKYSALMQYICGK